MRKYPTRSGAVAYVDEAEIVAIHPLFGDSLNASRLRLRGGIFVDVAESTDAAYRRATQPAAMQNVTTTPDALVLQGIEGDASDKSVA